jgi:hypothetical protein
MKTIAIAFFALVSFSSISQVEKIKSRELDHLIFTKINEYRVSKGLKPFIAFEDSLMEQYSYRLTILNSERVGPIHSDSVGYYCNGECIFRYSATGTLNTVISDVFEYDYESIATETVTHWINSPTHENILSGKTFNVATVTSILVIDRKNKSIQFDTSLHTLEKEIMTSSKYQYKIKNRV